ncbi:hypothetical protein [Pseudomonas syringae]|uniref:hypothetical protein n=1 Tax=Pseudomonas syringae TaxID=317 RepID=UPI000ABC792C|nr:hypothetical protein [Pseudomonas syringae]
MVVRPFAYLVLTVIVRVRLCIQNAKLVWEVEAESHFEAMTKYYAHMQWGEYVTHFPEQDMTPYRKLGWD